MMENQDGFLVVYREKGVERVLSFTEAEQLLREIRETEESLAQAVQKTRQKIRAAAIWAQWGAAPDVFQEASGGLMRFMGGDWWVLLPGADSAAINERHSLRFKEPAGWLRSRPGVKAHYWHLPYKALCGKTLKGATRGPGNRVDPSLRVRFCATCASRLHEEKK